MAGIWANIGNVSVFSQLPINNVRVPQAARGAWTFTSPGPPKLGQILLDFLTCPRYLLLLEEAARVALPQ